MDGERKQKEKEVKETLLKAAEYENDKKTVITRRINILLAMGVLCGIAYIVMSFIGLEGENRIFDSFYGVSLGAMFGCTVIGFVITSRYASKFREAKVRIWEFIKGEA